MSDRPIIFGAPMIRVLLAGRKTQTRRVLKPQPRTAPIRQIDGRWMDGVQIDDVRPLRIPYAPGDRIWVREAFYLTDDGEAEAVVYAEDEVGVAEHRETIGRMQANLHLTDAWAAPHLRLRSPIHMPRWASRLTLNVTDVRVQRVQEISEEDALAEGVEPPETERYDHDWKICRKCGGTGLHGALGDRLGYVEVDCRDCDTCAKRYRALWDGINAKRGFGWDANPWVAAYSFDVRQENIDADKPVVAS